MCGIAGLFQIDGRQIDLTTFELMIDSLKHRGPNGRGIYFGDNKSLALGHRRLTILDLSERGKQPMSDPSGRYWITFNGEIYNFLELRSELERMGTRFISDSDTEVILAAYKEWGSDCQLKFNGMWAFAIWDTQARTLFLSRDRFGVKPLLYSFNGRQFAFASELKAFLFLPDFDFSFDLNKVATSLRDPSLLEPTPYTLAKGISRLQAGHCMTVSAKSGLRVKRWWNTLDHLISTPSNFEEQTAQFNEIFYDACKIRMRSDVNIGNALSGGLDSSSVLAVMSDLLAKRDLSHERIGNNLRAFVALYPQTSQDEFPFAKQMIDATKVAASYANIDSSTFMDHFDDCLYQHEDIFELPFGPWMLYRKFSEEGIVISIDGHGGDELLGGYHHQVEANIYHSLFPVPDFWHAKELINILNSLYAANSQLVKTSVSATFLRSVIHRLRSYPQFQFALQNLYRKGKQFIKGRKSFEWNRLPLDHSVFQFMQIYSGAKLSGLNRILYEDFHLRTLPMILRNFDRASMAHGVEVRAPFLDWRLVCYAFSLPPKSKIGGGWTKRILREAMKGILPNPIRERSTKMGFTNPMLEWIGGAFKPFILDSVASRSFLDSPLWNGLEINEFVQKCYKENDLRGVRRAWEYIQTNHLFRLFGAKLAVK